MADNTSDLITSGFTPAQFALMKELTKGGTAPAGSSPQFNPLSAGSYSGQTFSAPIPIVNPGLIDYGTINAANAARKAMAMAATEQTFSNITAPVWNVERANQMGAAISNNGVRAYTKIMAELKEIAGNDPAYLTALVKSDVRLNNVKSLVEANAATAEAFSAIMSDPVKEADPFKADLRAEVPTKFGIWGNAIDTDADYETTKKAADEIIKTQALLKGPSAYDIVVPNLGDKYLDPTVKQILDGTIEIDQKGFETLVTAVDKGTAVDKVALKSDLDARKNEIMGEVGKTPYNNFVELYGQGKGADIAWNNFTKAIENNYESKIKQSAPQLIASWKQKQGSTKISTGGNKDKAVGYFQKEIDTPSQVWNNLPEDQRTFDTFKESLDYDWKMPDSALRTSSAVMQKELPPIANEYKLSRINSISILGGVNRGGVKDPISKTLKGMKTDDSAGMRLWDYPLTTAGINQLVDNGVLVKDTTVKKVDNNYTGVILKKNTRPVAKIFFVDETKKGRATDGSTWTQVANTDNIKNATQYVGVSTADELEIWSGGVLYRPTGSGVMVALPNTPDNVNILGNELYPSGSQETTTEPIRIEMGSGGSGGGTSYGD